MTPEITIETLPLEEQLQIQLFIRGVANLPAPELLEMLIDLYVQMKLREYCYKHLLRHNWGLGDSPSDRSFAQWMAGGEE